MSSALLFGVMVGCSPWIRQAPPEPSQLPPRPMAQDVVVLEVAFVHLSTDDAEDEAKIWKQLDETVIDADTRRSCASNGMRVGLAGTQLPDELRRLVARTSKEIEQAPSDDSNAADAQFAKQRRVQMRSGRRAKIVASSTHDQLSVLARDEEGHIQGKQFVGAQCLFSVKAFPKEDGRTKLEVVPEIEHGELKNRWIALDGALVQQSGKDRQVYDDLELELLTSPGQTLVLGSAEHPSGIGQPFFTTSKPAPRRLLLLLRVAQTQRDDLFEQRDLSEEVLSATDSKP